MKNTTNLSLLLVLLIMFSGLIVWNNDQNKKNAHGQYFLGTTENKHESPAKMDSIETSSDTTVSGIEKFPLDFTDSLGNPIATFSHG